MLFMPTIEALIDDLQERLDVFTHQTMSDKLRAEIADCLMRHLEVVLKDTVTNEGGDIDEEPNEKKHAEIPLDEEDMALLVEIREAYEKQKRDKLHEEPDWSVDDDFIEFWAAGECAPCEHLKLRIDGGDGDFSLYKGSDLHDGFSSLEQVEAAFPEVAVSLQDWKAGVTVPFAQLLLAAFTLAQDQLTNSLFEREE